MRVPVQEFAAGLHRGDHARHDVVAPEQAADFGQDAPPGGRAELAQQHSPSAKVTDGRPGVPADGTTYASEQNAASVGQHPERPPGDRGLPRRKATSQ